jgi:hypothetical protein
LCTTYRAGDTFVEQANRVHLVANNSGSPAEFIAIHIRPNDAPGRTDAAQPDCPSQARNRAAEDKGRPASLPHVSWPTCQQCEAVGLVKELPINDCRLIACIGNHTMLLNWKAGGQP